MDKTVLILGAGFSVPYGYPSGEGLVKDIIAKGKRNRGAREALARGLEDYSSALSIDRYLSENAQHLALGIGAIVEELLEAENKSLSETPDESSDIIKLLLNELSEASFSRLTILSFNYDRLLEWRFLRKLRALHGDENIAQSKLNLLKIEHIHGRLTSLTKEEEAISNPNWGPPVPYAMQSATAMSVDTRKRFEKTLFDSAQTHFKTVYTNDNKPNTVAVGAIKAAKRIFFLGFGFDEKNMQKLGIGVPGITYAWNSKCVAGTILNLKPVPLKKVVSAYPFLGGRLHALTAKELFTEKHCLYDSSLDIVKTSVALKDCCEITAIQEQKPRNYNDVGYQDDVDCIECGRVATIYYSRRTSEDPWFVQVRLKRASR